MQINVKLVLVCWILSVDYVGDIWRMYLHLSQPMYLMYLSNWARHKNCSNDRRWYWHQSTMSDDLTDHVYRMWKVKYSNIWPNQTIVSDQSELTILLCQPMIIYVCSEDDVNWVQRPSTFHILYTWSLDDLNNTFTTTTITLQHSSLDQRHNYLHSIRIIETRNFLNHCRDCGMLLHADYSDLQTWRQDSVV